MRMFQRLLLIVLSITFLSACSILDGDNDNELKTGTVVHLDFEGGFWGIVSDDNQNLDPLNLPKEYCVAGKRIWFSYKEKADMMSTHMWGTIIELIEVKELK
ncbi:MAG: hypothetical protein WCZ90_08985 [Melioribacteraceae bacterium]